MANLLVGRYNKIKLQVSKYFYWDFYLSKDSSGKFYNGNKLWDKCLIGEINPNIEECIENNTLYTSKKYLWDKAKNDGVILNDIGFTGLDNGFISYNPEIDDFKTIFTQSTFSIDSNDYRFFMNPIKGYYHNFDYSTSIVKNSSGLKYINFSGGFYQGFSKLDGFNYEVLPTKPQKEFAWEFILKPKDINIPNTINEKYPENKGIFFYIGTRAENKFWYCSNNGVLNFEESKNDENYINDYFLDDYIIDISDYNNQDTFDYCSLATSSGVPLNKPNTIRVKTDNKYLFFNRTKDGYIANDFINSDEKFEDSDHYIEYQNKNNKLNYYLLFNRTKNGYTTSDFGDTCYMGCDGSNTNSNKPKPDIDLYDDTINILNDLYYNCLGFRITDDGKIGYRYLVRNCTPTETEPNDYKILEEYSKEGMVRMNEWNHIIIRFITNQFIMNPECDNRQRKGRFYIYINGKLKFISKELLEPNFKQLNEFFEKQEAVPYNISLGGGSQGLMDMLLSDNPEQYIRYIFPIEQNFAGTLNGDMFTFRFYNCQMDYTKIFNNYLYYKNYLKKFDIYL